MIHLLIFLVAYSFQGSSLTVDADNDHVNPKDSLLLVNVHFLNSTGKKLRIIELKSTGRKEICNEPGWDISIFHKDSITNENIEYFIPYALCRPSELILQDNEKYYVKIFINFRYLYNRYSKHWPNINRDYGEYEIQLKLSTHKRDPIVSNKLKVLYEDKN